MRFERLFVVLAALVVIAAPGSPWAAAAPYTPPVTFEGQKGVQVWFGRVKATGKWCAFGLDEMKRRFARSEVLAEDSGWARYDGDRLLSITHVQENEDAYAEDRYVIGAKGEVARMIRTGHYIKDPWASVTFEPDSQGRLRLTAASKQVVQRMGQAEYETYFVDWDHFSTLAQIPFAKLADGFRDPAKRAAAGAFCP
jgi:hypothetical protein